MANDPVPLDPEMTDGLVEAARTGDDAAFRALHAAQRGRVFRIAYRILGDETDAHDATQETFIRAFAALAGFRGEASFATWLHSIAVSTSLTALRKRQRMRERTISLGTGAARLTTEPQRKDPILRDRIHRAIDALPDRMRVILIMYDMEGYSHVEIGATLGIAPSTSRAHLTAARARVRDTLGPVAGVEG